MTKNLIHVSKTYTWNNLMKVYLPNPGVTRTTSDPAKQLAKQLRITKKKLRKLSKVQRRQAREAANINQ